MEILELMSSGKARTITQAARLIGIDPARVYTWAQNDKDFQDMVRLAREVIADDLEDELGQHKNFIPKMMILKGYRPMFRDNYKFEITNTRLEELLEELKKLGQQEEPKQIEAAPKQIVESITVPAMAGMPINIDNKQEGE